jgi:integrase
MQDGSVTVERRKKGPDVWCFRWREGGPGGRKIHRRIVLGTADDLKTIASARKAVVGLRREINLNDARIRRESITLADLSRHFQQRELVRGNTRIACSTRKAYEGYLKKWIEPRWGEYRLLKIRAVEVESWLKSLDRAPGTRCKIRNVMSLLFNHGRRHDLCDRNPVSFVHQQKDGLEFGGKGYSFALACVEMCQWLNPQRWTRISRRNWWTSHRTGSL